MSDQYSHVPIYVVVTGQATEAEDEGVPGVYRLDVLVSDAEFEWTPEFESAVGEAASECFHNKVCIGVLDDFQISYVMESGELLERGDVELHEHVKGAEFWGSVCSEVTDLPEVFPFMRNEGWEHFFLNPETGRESTYSTRWMIDLKTRQFVYADVMRGAKWRALSREEAADLMESIKDNDVFTDPFERDVELLGDPTGEQEAESEDALASYVFGEGVTVEGQESGWSREDDLASLVTDWTKVVYVSYDDDGPDDPSHKLSFHVKFKIGTDEVADIYALDMKSGSDVGRPGVPPEDVSSDEIRMRG